MGAVWLLEASPPSDCIIMSLTLEQLNALPAAEYEAAIDFVYEHQPWVAQASTSKRPFASLDDIHRTLKEIVEAASEETKVAILNSDTPLLPVTPEVAAGKPDFKNAGLDRCTEEEAAKLLRLNEEYKAKFGFLFQLAIRGYSLQGILENFESRMNNSGADELRTCLDQLHRVARFRLERLIKQ